MSKRVAPLAAITIGILFSFSACTTWAPPVSPPNLDTVNKNCQQTVKDGTYYSAAFDGTFFWAAGSGGRLTRIDENNIAENQKSFTDQDLKGMWSGDGKILVCGDNGTILYSADGKDFSLINTDSKEDLNSATSFNNTFFIGGSRGTILSSSEGTTWSQIQLPVQNDIISIEANDEMIMAITKETDYFISTDGVTWSWKNYNEYYEGYADLCIFNSLENMGDTFFVVGQMKDDPDRPFVMYTESGEIWFYKPLTEINGTDPSTLFPLNINSLGFNLDQIIAACNKGRLLTITNCAECNKMDEYTQQDLYDVIFGNEKLLMVGADYTHSIVDTNNIRQYNIKPEQAYEDYNYRGAIIIDVRSDEEWAEGHIAGALHIPVGEIGANLLKQVPDKTTTLIFYCAVGGRAQTALEEALKMGYQQVYNLGGISEWPYEIE
ncbi:rhodanese-like domain-containing protein [Oscillospiraceae bacterium MB08-C2-2]|nr:rhodanese-like domain-containing protein [Oscillospiraceae bacterium MB08-C2-2]